MIGTMAALLGAAGAGAAFVRLAPTRAADWDVDPAVDGRTGPGRHLVAEGGDRPPVVLSAPPEAVLGALSEIAAADGARRIAWRADEGRATFEARSRVIGFPDYISVRVLPDGTGSVLTAYARLRYGYDDMGVNRGRLERWIDLLEERFGG
ncbi:MAG: DUF1499 domain-containing protein [Hasllibacter sp.]